MLCTVPMLCIDVLRVILTNNFYSPINQLVFAVDADCVLCVGSNFLLLCDCSINLSKPIGFFTYRQVKHSKILHGARFAFECFVRISELTATLALCIIS